MKLEQPLSIQRSTGILMMMIYNTSRKKRVHDHKTKQPGRITMQKESRMAGSRSRRVNLKTGSLDLTLEL
jgi:hypothetical protein